MYQSFEVAYFTGFLPVKFIPSDLVIYFDPATCFIFTMFIWINSLVLLVSHYLQHRSVELQFNAQLLGTWQQIKTHGSVNPDGQMTGELPQSNAESIVSWKPNTTYMKD